MTTNRIRHLFESDENRVNLVTTVVYATLLNDEDNTRDTKRTLVLAVRDCLERLLHRKPTKEEIARVMRGEMG